MIFDNHVTKIYYSKESSGAERGLASGEGASRTLINKTLINTVSSVSVIEESFYQVTSISKGNQSYST